MLISPEASTQPWEVHGTNESLIFSAYALERGYAVELDETTQWLINIAPVLTAKLTRLSGITSLDDENERAVRRTEFELFEHLSKIGRSDCPDMTVIDAVVDIVKDAWPITAAAFSEEERRLMSDLEGHSIFIDSIKHLVPMPTTV